MDANTQRYLNLHWLDRQALVSTWGPLVATRFETGENAKVKPGFGFRPELGGLVFDESDLIDFNFELLQCGAGSFAVIEDVGQQSWTPDMPPAFMRFHFPTGVGWNELAGSCLLAQDVFQRPIRKFFVISDNGRVGKYVDNDAWPPTEVHFSCQA